MDQAKQLLAGEWATFFTCEQGFGGKKGTLRFSNTSQNGFIGEWKI